MKPFNFPVMMGKLGNWPGIVSTTAAQALLAELRQLPRDSIVGELGFNGGRTTILTSWAAVENGFKIGILGQISNELAPWLRRGLALFNLDRVLISGLPQGATFDALIVNAQVRAMPEMIELVRPGGKMLVLHQPACEIPGAERIIDLPNEITIYRRQHDYSVAVPDSQQERPFKVIKGGQAFAQQEESDRREQAARQESPAIELPGPDDPRDDLNGSGPSEEDSEAIRER